MILRELLEKISDVDGLPDEWEEWTDILPSSENRINLCFMPEDTTWVTAFAEHPIFIPFYDCEVTGIRPGDDEDTINIWVDYENFIPRLIARNKPADPSEEGAETTTEATE